MDELQNDKAASNEFRIGGLEKAVEAFQRWGDALTASIAKLSDQVVTGQQTKWPLIIGGFGLLLTLSAFMGGMLLGYVREHDTRQQVEYDRLEQRAYDAMLREIEK